MCLRLRIRANLLALVFASSLGALHAQTTWYVDAGAVPPGLGTQAAPYASIQYAIERVTTAPGDTVLVAAGTYVERVHLAKAITVRAKAGPARTWIVKPASPGAEFVFMGPQDPDIADTTRLIGFTITGMVGAGSAVNLHGGGLERCVVAGNDGLGVSSIYGTLRHCTVADNGNGVFFATFGQTTLENSIVSGNGIDIMGIGGFGTARFTTFGTNPGGFMSTAGPGNESTDPLFVDPDAGDYRLSRSSPCIDTADPFAPTDRDGSPADRGALAFRLPFGQRGR